MLSTLLSICSLALVPQPLNGNPCDIGAWEAPVTHDVTGFLVPPPDDRFIAVHMSLIPKGPNRGKVLVWDYEYDQVGTQWTQRWSIIDPTTPGTLEFTNFDLALPNGFGDFFCAGFTWTADGKLFVVGGTTQYAPGSHHAGQATWLGGYLTYLYDPAVGPHGQWERQPDLAIPRWYPSVTQLSSGAMMVSGGTRDTGGHTTNDYEVFDPVTKTWETNGGNRLFPGPPGPNFATYPRLQVISTGEVFYSGPNGRAFRMEHEVLPGAWTTMDRQSFDNREDGSALLAPSCYGEDRVISLGGAAFLDGNPYGFTDSVDMCWAAGASPAEWAWAPLDALNIGRSDANAVILPDAGIVVFGGEVDSEDPRNQAFTRIPERLDPQTRTWSMLAPRSSNADYHSTAVLLPDGRVLTGGGEHRTWDYQVYVPGYLECGAPRPELLVAPTVLRYHSTLPQTHRISHRPMPTGNFVKSVVLMRPGTTTHHSDFTQRHVELEAVGYQTPGTIDVIAPLDAQHAPPGHYMMFLVSNAGVPSMASWVELR